MELNKINKMEALYNNRKNIKNSIALCTRYWTSYKIFDLDVFLHKANYVAATTFEVNTSSVELYLGSAFMNIELENFDKSQAMLASVNKYKTYLKINNKSAYVFFLYMYSLLELRKNNKKNTEKYLKILTDFEYEVDNGIPQMLIGSLKLEQQELNKSLQYFELSYRLGNRSSFLFASLNEIFKLKLRNLKEQSLLMPFLNWGISQGIDLTDVINFYCKDINIAFLDDRGLGEKIYEHYPDNWILQKICMNFIRDRNYSKSAYKYYHDAELKQVHLDGLIYAIVKTAYNTEREDLSRYTLEQFLNNERLDAELAPFVFHLLVTSKKFKDLATKYAVKIIQYGIDSLQKELDGRYFNSIYKFVLDRSNLEKLPERFTKKIIETLARDAFEFEIFTENVEVRHVWIIEREKREMTLCNLEKGYGVIKASSEKFSYVCFNEGMKNIQDVKLTIIRQVENADIVLYSHLFKLGIITLDLLIVLSKHFISLKKFEEHSIDLLNKTLEQTGISDSFKMQLGASIGNILFSQSNSDEALEYYKGVDEQYLSDKHIEQMLNVFISTKEYEKAVSVISKNSHLISDSALFSSIAKIPNTKELAGQLAAEAYELILKAWYDQSILEVVLQHYKGSQERWQTLNKALMSINAKDIRLLETILTNSMNMHRLDEGSQLVFAEMYDDNPDHELIDKFAYYCVYEMMINSASLEYEAIQVLERMYLKNNDKLIAYGLSHTYLANNITTLNSEDILNDTLKLMESDGLIFPIFKDIKDKNFITPYIEKNEPLLYKDSPGKNIYVYYKVNDEQKHKKQKMQYFKFGTYMANITLFYGETLRYYFSEEKSSGSIDTKEFSFEKKKPYVNEEERDNYFKINNALVYEQMFRYEQVEAIITEVLEEPKKTKAKIIN